MTIIRLCLNTTKFICFPLNTAFSVFLLILYHTKFVERCFYAKVKIKKLDVNNSYKLHNFRQIYLNA